MSDRDASRDENGDSSGREARPGDPDRRAPAEDRREEARGTDADRDGAWGTGDERDPRDADDQGEADDEEEIGVMEVLFGASGEDAPPRPTIERESPEPENALFVALGVLLALFVVLRLWSLAGG